MLAATLCLWAGTFVPIAARDLVQRGLQLERLGEEARRHDREVRKLEDSIGRLSNCVDRARTKVRWAACTCRATAFPQRQAESRQGCHTRGNLIPTGPCILYQAGHASRQLPCRDKLTEAKAATGGVDAREDEEVKGMLAKLPATLSELLELARELEAEAEGIQLGNPRVVRCALGVLCPLKAGHMLGGCSC